jgi:hypothetical protein
MLNSPIDWTGPPGLAAVVLVVLILISMVLRAPIRRFVIRTAEIFSIVAIVLGTAAGALSAYSWAVMSPMYSSGTSFPIIAAILGGIGAFAVGAITFAFLFVLINISENTRK